jgi:hypothetical protein
MNQRDDAVESPSECDTAFDQMPWLLNGTLPMQEAREFERHVADCARCAAILERERELLATLKAPAGNVEHSPLAGWQRFESALQSSAAPAAKPRGSARRRRIGLRATLLLQAAAIATLAVALLIVVAGRTPQRGPTEYLTVSEPDAVLHHVGPAWRVAFAADVTHPAAAAMIALHGLHALSGPTSGNVYAVEAAPDTAGDIEALRLTPGVLLVESLAAPPTPHGTQ